MNNTENVLTNLCTEHVQAILKLHIKTKNGLKIIQFLKIYISQSMQIFVPVKTQNAGMWMDTVTHTIVEIQHQIFIFKTKGNRKIYNKFR